MPWPAPSTWSSAATPAWRPARTCSGSTPSLPQELDGLDFEVRYRGHWGINLHLTPQLLRVRVAASDAAPVRIGINGQVVELPPGSTREFPL